MNVTEECIAARSWKFFYFYCNALHQSLVIADFTAGLNEALQLYTDNCIEKMKIKGRSATFTKDLLNSITYVSS